MDELSIVMAIKAARGLQVHRKDKDLMSDTGGTSKVREHEPDQKPPREDLKKPFRTKDKPSEERDKDTDNDPDRDKDSDMKVSVRCDFLAMKVAKDILAGKAEKEVERLLQLVIRGTPFVGKAFSVGGFVRDELLGIESKDLDVVVEMRDGAEKLTKMLHNMFPEQISTPRRMGSAYPIWQIAFKENILLSGKEYQTAGAVVEFADSQKESFPDPESRQRVTEYGTIQEDVERRDFTVNMLLKDLTTGELKDLTGTSVKDIEDGILRGHPGVDFNKILSDDPLRMIRLVRFQVKYGWDIPMSVLKTVRTNADRIKIVSEERIRDELIKIMELGKLARAVKLMKAVGLLQHVLPEVQALADVQQEQARGHHQEGDVLKHTLLVLQSTKPGVENQLAALLHDIGKPDSQRVVGENVVFYGHEKIGGEIAEAIMRRLKFDNTVVNTVRTMVENHMRPHFLERGGYTPKALRHFINDVGMELVDAIMDLAEADALGNLPVENTIPDLRAAIEKVRTPVVQAEKLPVDGHDIQRYLKIAPGRMVGEAIQFLKDKKYEWELHGKKMTRDDALVLLRDRFMVASIIASTDIMRAKSELAKYPNTFHEAIKSIG